jgi:hypothetical protein
MASSLVLSVGGAQIGSLYFSDSEVLSTTTTTAAAADDLVVDAERMSVPAVRVVWQISEIILKLRNPIYGIAVSNYHWHLRTYTHTFNGIVYMCQTYLTLCCVY